MPALPVLQAHTVQPASLAVATAAAAAPLLQRQISAGAQMAQAAASMQAVQPDNTAASSESLKAHATALKVCLPPCQACTTIWSPLWCVVPARQAGAWYQTLCDRNLFQHSDHSLVQAHADNLEMQSALVASEPAKVQVAVKARSLHAQAQSLERQAEAQTLQVQQFTPILLPRAMAVLLERFVSTKTSCANSRLALPCMSLP